MEYAISEAGLQESDTYVSRNQNTVAQYIATRPIMGLFLAAKRRPETRVEMQWWEQEGLDLEGMRKAAQEVDQTEVVEDRDGMKRAWKEKSSDIPPLYQEIHICIGCLS